jgi:hypothetical protein
MRWGTSATNIGVGPGLCGFRIISLLGTPVNKS